MDFGSFVLQADGALLIVALAVFSFLPPIIFAAWIRNTERFGREPWWAIAKMFLWGAVFAVIIGVILSILFVLLFQVATPVQEALARRFQDPTTIVLVLVIAPFTEEFAKGFGVWRGRGVIREPEDGLVYGATCGLGFSATENLLYGLLALEGGLVASILTIAVRSFSSSLLHASATSLTGYGIARNRLWGPRFAIFPFYLTAVAMHSAFNGLASIAESYSVTYGDVAGLLALGAAIVFVLVTITIVRSRIVRHEGRQGWIR